MAPGILFAAQVNVMLLVCYLVARWYVVPVLTRLSLVEALTPLLLVHATRVVGLCFLADAVTDPDLPRELAVPAAAGDMAACVLALAALGALRYRLSGAILLVWIMNVVGALDLIYVTVQGMIVQFPTYRLGPVWFIPTFLGPVMIVTHGLMIWLLLRRSREPIGAEGPATPA